MKVLITGAAGNIGTALIKAFDKSKYQIRGLDIRPMPLLTDTIVGDVTDFATVSRATKDMDAVIHLTNVGGEWQQALQSITGTYNVFESAHQNGVKTIAFASRGGLFPQARIPRKVQRTADLLWFPDSYYTITKVVGEGFGDMYSARYGMNVVSVRIGGYEPSGNPLIDPHQLSERDCVAAFEAAINYKGGKHERVFGVSDSNWQLYDVEHGRKAIGYYPKDKSVVPEEKIQR
ncbi:MAG: NAD(P)-dependent oxidoreductase [SAR202 cluster bacterium]|nr:NAD(P)-dependent oxidoreductase [SAR202 cluster bacterium]